MKKLLFLILIISGLSPLFADVDFSIRFYDRRIYYVTDDPILVQFTITNNTPSPYRFRLAEERAFSIDFDVRTMNNRLVDESDTLIRIRTQNQQVYYREITIESGEAYSFIEDLRDYAKFSQPGSYRVNARIYPELRRPSGSMPWPAGSIESNYLNLSIRPSPIQGPDGIPLDMDTATGAALVRQAIPPDEVVSYMLTARMQSQWERFFLYLDLEAMHSRDSGRRRRWQAETEEGRRRMLAEYRQSLQNATVDGDISVVPTSFEILRTVYEENEGSVIVRLRFDYQRYSELKLYTYYLEKRDIYWVIVNYTVGESSRVTNN